MKFSNDLHGEYRMKVEEEREPIQLSVSCQMNKTDSFFSFFFVMEIL
jgi:hypothetical protein